MEDNTSHCAQGAGGQHVSQWTESWRTMRLTVDRELEDNASHSAQRAGGQRVLQWTESWRTTRLTVDRELEDNTSHSGQKAGGQRVSLCTESWRTTRLTVHRDLEDNASHRAQRAGGQRVSLCTESWRTTRVIVHRELEDNACHCAQRAGGQRVYVEERVKVHALHLTAKGQHFQTQICDCTTSNQLHAVSNQLNGNCAVHVLPTDISVPEFPEPFCNYYYSISFSDKIKDIPRELDSCPVHNDFIPFDGISNMF